MSLVLLAIAAVVLSTVGAIKEDAILQGIGRLLAVCIIAYIYLWRWTN